MVVLRYKYIDKFKYKVVAHDDICWLINIIVLAPAHVIEILLP